MVVRDISKLLKLSTFSQIRPHTPEGGLHLKKGEKYAFFTPECSG